MRRCSWWLTLWLQLCLHLQLILRVRVPDSHSDVPLGEKYGANVEACAELVRDDGSPQSSQLRVCWTWP